VRSRLPIVLLMIAHLVGVGSLRGQAPKAPGADVPDERVRYSKVRQFFLPFQADPQREINELRLYVQRDGGEWSYLTSAQPTQKGFNFTTNQDGSYGMTVQTVYKNGTKEPAQDQLRAELKIVIDTVPPKIALRPFSTPEGAAGVEWDIVDDHLDANSIRLEYRWPGMADWAPIDKGVHFKAHDQRTWMLKAEQRIEIRVKAADLAKNDTTSQGVYTSLAVGNSQQFQGGSGGTSTAPASNSDIAPVRSSATQHYVNHTVIKLNYNVIVGPSGIKNATLWWQDEQHKWAKAEGVISDPKPEAPAVFPGEKPRTEPLSLTYDVKKDGTYGFIIVVESRAGASGREPKPTDPPHTVVIVDTTPPVVTMNEPKVRPNGASAQGALVDISWTATDKNMAAAPITLEYSEKPDVNGPWRSIAEKIENTGKYTWSVPPTEPYSFWVRITAVDRAGNKASVVSKQNVIVDLTVPQVEIRDVAPAK
jgi:hypothetical protein